MAHWVRLVAAVILLCFGSGYALGQSDQRVALVIGNGNYTSVGKLKNPANDAKAMGAMLRRAGFDVVEVEDATRRSMVEAVRKFAEKLTPGGVGLFFYAGHAVQAQGINYLVPLDAILAVEDDLQYEAFDVQRVLAKLDEARVRLSVVILDACRDNPFAKSFRSTTRGLALIDPPRGTFIAYSTGPGQVAEDGDGADSVYTAELLKAMSEPGRKLQDVFSRVADAVELQTNHAQTPWTHSTFRGDFYFLGRSTAQPAAASLPPENGRSQAPRLSLVVLPFDNLDNTSDQNSVADGITEDLTTSLARQTSLVVTARNTSFTYKGKPIDIKRLGTELGVRYAVEGSVRKVGTSLRVNVQLVSTETGTHLWAYQADAEAGVGDLGRDEVVRRISAELRRQIIDAEGAHSAHEPSGKPDAVDVLLQAGAFQNLTGNPQQLPTLIGMYERALQLDPSSSTALAGLAIALMDGLTGLEDPTAPATIDRVEGLVSKAESLKPRNGFVMIARGDLLLWEGHALEASTAFQNVIDSDPDLALGYHMLGVSMLLVGRTAEVISNEERSIQLDPHFPWSWTRFKFMDLASLFLGRYDEAVIWAQRSLAALPGGSANIRAGRYAEIAAAQALAGRTEEAHAAAAEAIRLWPILTARTWWQGNVANPVQVAQIGRVREGMRLAGIPDHAEEDADFGVVSDDALQIKPGARTPATVPGGRVIRTAELPTFLQQNKPLVLDVNGWGKSIPGAIALPGAGIDGTTSDPFQARLERKMQALTHGDRSMPVVTMAWNADRFSGRNLALRLAALGYMNVIWYRGGREAWEVAGLPETDLMVQKW